MDTGSKELITQLNEIKEQLFDAPSDIKESFNEIVGWFSFADNYDKYIKVFVIGDLDKPDKISFGTLSRSPGKYAGFKWYKDAKDYQAPKGLWSELYKVKDLLNSGRKEEAYDIWSKIKSKLTPVRKDYGDYK